MTKYFAVSGGRTAHFESINDNDAWKQAKKAVGRSAKLFREVPPVATEVTWGDPTVGDDPGPRPWVREICRGMGDDVFDEKFHVGEFHD
jgi:hypothetical protein